MKKRKAQAVTEPTSAACDETPLAPQDDIDRVALPRCWSCGIIVTRSAYETGTTRHLNHCERHGPRSELKDSGTSS
jgi:hypothetical protein